MFPVKYIVVSKLLCFDLVLLWWLCFVTVKVGGYCNVREEQRLT